MKQLSDLPYEPYSLESPEMIYNHIPGFPPANTPPFKILKETHTMYLQEWQAKHAEQVGFIVTKLNEKDLS